MDGKPNGFIVKYINATFLWKTSALPCPPQVATMQFPVTRVRLTGEIPFFDHIRVKAMCGSGKDPMACEMIRLGFRFPVEDSNNLSTLEGAAGGGLPGP